MSPVVLTPGKPHTFCCKFENIHGFKGFTDNVATYGQVFKEFSWSKDGESWSYWSELSRQNLQNIKLAEHSNIDVKCRYTLNGGPQTSATVYSIEFYPLCSEEVVSTPSFESAQQAQSTSTTGNSTADAILEMAQGSFNPYAVNAQYNLYNQLSNSVSNMFGIDSVYFRATPVDRSGDVIFKEWTLYDVDDPKCVKVLINNNEMPDLNPQYNPFGIEYTQPFEVEIVKDEFQNVFGTDTVPQKGDVVYIPLLSTRLYEVTSSVPNRGFMYQEISWKLNLAIYTPKSNRNLSEKSVNMLDYAIESPIADVPQSQEGLFGETLRAEEEKLTVPQQLDPFVGTLRDPIREMVSDDLKILGIDLDNHGVKVADSCYDLSSLIGTSAEIAVIYNKIQNFKPEQDFAFTTWFSMVKNPSVQSLVKKISVDGNKCTLTTDKVMTNIKEGDYIGVERQGRLGFYATVESIENNIIVSEIPDFVVERLDSISNAWASASGYIVQKTIPSTLLHGYSEGKGIKLELFIGRYMVYTVDGNQTMFDFSKKLEDGKWYALGLNHSAAFSQVFASIYKIGDDIKTSALENVYKSVNNVLPVEAREDNVEIQFILKKGLHMQTNIRIYDESIPEDKLSPILNQHVISDANNAILVDNAKPVNRIPYLGKIK